MVMDGRDTISMSIIESKLFFVIMNIVEMSNATYEEARRAMFKVLNYIYAKEHDGNE